MPTAQIVENLGEGYYRCRLSEPREGYDYVIVAPELVADLPGLTRVYGSPEHGGIDFSAEGDRPVILKEYRGLLTCREALAGAGIELAGNQ